MTYIVIELQKFEGNVHTLSYSYDNLIDAESQFFYLLSVAAKSQTEKHAVVLLNENGRALRDEYYEHKEEEAAND